MSDLWAAKRDQARQGVQPLALRMRPRSIDEVVGQDHILGDDDRGQPRLLRRMIQADAITSLILHGPPGTGKTTLAEVIARATDRAFVRENAASVGVKRIREIIDDADRRLGDTGRRTILFLDEIHRFTKAQQDVLLADVERGLVTLIGATTENPLFSVNAALISRSTLFRLDPLSQADIERVVRAAITDTDRGYGKRRIQITKEALKVWAVKSEGDARRALTALEVAVESSRDAELEKTEGSDAPRPTLTIDARLAQASIQEKLAVYGDDGHYDAASAMIKSVRGSDPDAAVYWIARMLDAGEDPRFVARRLAILASEDVGNADPHAVVMAQACWDLVERIGMPEARITLGHLATYLALAPKSNAAYLAIINAMADVQEGRVRPVPLFLRDPNSSPVSAGPEGAGMKLRQTRKAGTDAEGVGDAGQRYDYTHASEHRTSIGGVSGQDYLGVDRAYYQPTDTGAEGALKQRLAEVRALRERLRRGDDGHA